MLKYVLTALTMILSSSAHAANDTGPKLNGLTRGVGGFIGSQITTAQLLLDASTVKTAFSIRNESASAMLVVCSAKITTNPTLNEPGCHTLPPYSVIAYPGNSNYLPSEIFYAACASTMTCNVTVESH